MVRVLRRHVRQTITLNCSFMTGKKEGHGQSEYIIFTLFFPHATVGEVVKISIIKVSWKRSKIYIYDQKITNRN